MKNLCITVRWLDDRYHGQNGDGEPEWPPSPLRLVQAMLSGARPQAGDAAALSALRWIEENLRQPPYIVAPRSQPGHTFTRFVPNNDSDRKFDRQERLTAKKVCPTLLLDPPTIHYIWRLGSFGDPIGVPIGSLSDMARRIVALGWGVDLAVGAASIISDEQSHALHGERWLPGTSASDDGLRVPIPGTLDDLLNRQKQFLHRLTLEGFVDPSPLSIYDKVAYRRATDPPIRPIVAFSLLKLDASGLRAFDTSRYGLTVTGMAKFAAKSVAEQNKWPDTGFMLGHGEPNGAEHVTIGSRRFAYLPLPTIERRGAANERVAGSIRRVILTTFAEDCGKEIAWARRSLSGQVLVDEATKTERALLSLLPANDKVVQCYTQSSAAWATVTPVVLPGYDDPAHYRRRIKCGVNAGEQRKLQEQIDDRIEGLLRKAIVQAGFSPTLAEYAGLEWRKGGFWPGTELANRYGVPDHLRRFPRFHVKIQWRDAEKKPSPVPGPICIGGGRFYGLGLFAAW